MEFENTEIEELKKKDKENEDKIKELEDKLLYQEVYNRRENLRFFGIPESTTGVENTSHQCINGIKVDNEEIRLSLFSDDLTGLLKNNLSLVNFL